MKTKLVNKVLAFILSAFTIFSLTSCKNVEENNNSSNSSGNELGDTNLVLAENGNSSYSIVIDNEASFSEQYAATFLQKYLQLSTGALLPIISDENIASVNEGKILSIGRNTLLENSGITITENEVSRDGYKIIRKDNAVYICGGGDTGTSFGVYEFLTHQIGFEPYTSDEIYYENKSTLYLKDFAYTDRPDFDYRMLVIADTDTSFLLRVVNPTESSAKYAGAASKDWIPGSAHTIRMVLPESEYKDKTEWSYTSGGKVSQLCLTNEELIETFIENLKQKIINNPDGRIVNISQDDHSTWCGCTTCKTEQDKYKISGYVVRFVNKVIAALEEWKKTACPERDWTYTTYAYRATSAPPVNGDINKGYSVIDKSCIPHSKLHIRLAPIEYCFSHSFNDENCEKNIVFYNELMGWASITDNFAVWDYLTNYYHYLPFFNDFSTHKENLQLYKRIGVNNILRQYISGGNLTQFQFFKNYIVAKLMWDTDADVEQLTDNFFNNYYKDVAPQLRAVYELFRTHLARMDVERNYRLHFTVYNDEIVSSTVWPRNIVEQAIKLLNDALQVCDSMQDRVLAEKLKKRVLEERTCVQYLQIFNKSNYVYDSQTYTSIYNSFKETSNYLRVTNYKEGVNISKFLASYAP